MRIDGTKAVLTLPRSDADVEVAISSRRGPRSTVEAWTRRALEETVGAARPFRIDQLTWPAENPFDSWLRFGAFDFIPDASASGPTSALIATWSGDVWRVDGLDEDLNELRWTRTATGLNQPFGVAVREGGEALVLGRDQITRLVDRDGDGRFDEYRTVANDWAVTSNFHEFGFGLVVVVHGALQQGQREAADPGGVPSA